MLSLKIKTKKGTLTREIPESWKECTLGMWIRISNWDGVDYVKGFSKIIGVDYDIISRSKSKKLYRTLFQIIEWTGEKIDWEHLPVPKYLDIGEKTIEVPKHLGEHTLGQKILVHETMMTSEDVTEALPTALAVYFDPLYHSKEFDRDRAIKFEAQMKELPVLEAYPVAVFFLTRFLRSPSYGIIDLLLLVVRSLKRGLKLRSSRVMIDLRG